MSRRTFMKKYGPILTPIHAGGGKVWFDRLQLDRLISRESGYRADESDPIKIEDQAFVQVQLEKRLR
ncbi:MAG: hypothetical protein ACKO1J_03675 [Tagaea sp.]